MAESLEALVAFRTPPRFTMMIGPAEKPLHRGMSSTKSTISIPESQPQRPKRLAFSYLCGGLSAQAKPQDQSQSKEPAAPFLASIVTACQTQPEFACSIEDIHQKGSEV